MLQKKCILYSIYAVNGLLSPVTINILKVIDDIELLNTISLKIIFLFAY